MKNWKIIVLIFVALAAIIVKITTDGKEDELLINAGILAVVMIIFWIFEIIPIYVTALFPLIFGIPLEVIDFKELASQYGNSNVYLFFGGFVMALALEKWDVHKQIALRIISAVGKKQIYILFGFLSSTALLSMWISNTATALMMLPMAIALISGLPDEFKNSRFTLFLLLSIAYGANVGGMATLVGSPPNVQMAGLLEERGITVTFVDWMKYGMPLSIILILVIFVVFYFLLGKENRSRPIEFEIERKPWSRDQKKVLLTFSILVLLWSFRELLTNYSGIIYRDETAVLFISAFLFVIPSRATKKPLLEWKDMSRVPWGILILFGGGLAMAKILENQGAIDWLLHNMGDFKTMAFPAMLSILVLVAIFGTEVMSNLALVAVLTPILISIGLETGIDPLKLCIPVTLAASCAFMLPVGTPPNAIVFASERIKISEMARYGFLINALATIIIISFFLLI